VTSAVRTNDSVDGWSQPVETRMADENLDQKIARLRTSLADDAGVPRVRGYFLPKWAAGVIMALAFGVVLALIGLYAALQAAQEQAESSNDAAECRSQVAADHIVALGAYLIADAGVNDASDNVFVGLLESAVEGEEISPDAAAGYLAAYQRAREYRVDVVREFQAEQERRANVVGACA
jgi:hypothetical protein